MAEPGSPPGPAATVPLNRVLLCCLAVLSVATAVIHFAVAGAHFQEYWLFGVFMLVVAWLQLAWAVLAVARPSRWLLWSGIVLNAGVIIVYIVTRTAGDVVGPTPNAVEPAGFGDLLCTLLEAVVVAGCAWLGTARTGRQAARRQVARARLLAVPGATAAVVAVLLSLALVDGGPEMVMSMNGDSASASTSGSPMPGASMPGSPVKLATTTPAGDITMPDTSMSMPGMKMASSQPCDTAPSLAQQQAAVTFVDHSWQDARKYQSLAAARAAGYVPITPTGAPVVHYLNRAYYLATVRGGSVLDLADPQSLVYANTSHGAVLVAAMFITSPGGPTPQPGGCLTQWHVHTNLCLAAGRVVGLTGLRAAGAAGATDCPAGSANRVTPAMIHVWFVPIPGGPTAIDATNAQVVQAAGQVKSPANGTA